MRTLILEPDGYAPEALAIYRRLGDVKYYNDPHQTFWAETIVTRLQQQIDKEYLVFAPNLKYIVSPTTGLDHIDLAYCKERGITVLSLKGDTDFLRTIPATAELTWGLILALTRNIPAACASVCAGEWERDRFIGHDLYGKTLGIIGYGRVGRQVGNIAYGMGMNVEWYDKYATFGCNSMACVCENSDIISIHVPLDTFTEGMVDDHFLSWMKPGAYFVNTSRGGIVDEQALLDTLLSGHLAGAALDVVCDERGERNPALISYAKNFNNLIITPHIGGATRESMAACEIHMAERLAEIVG